MKTSTIVQQEKVQKSTTSKKTDAYGFWDSQVSVIEHYQEKGTAIKSVRYSEMITDRL
jgi:hypothetical protein